LVNLTDNTNIARKASIMHVHFGRQFKTQTGCIDFSPLRTNASHKNIPRKERERVQYHNKRTESKMNNSSNYNLSMNGGLVSHDSNINISKNSWVNHQVTLIPGFYLLERTHRIINKIQIEEIKENLCKCFHTLSTQAKYEEMPVGAALLTPEYIEMHVYLWKVRDNGICVEVQRRQGDSIIFYRYAKYILQAAVGNFAANNNLDFHSKAKFTKNLLRSQFSGKESLSRSLEQAASLIWSDRIDARILGMERICMLTDPRKMDFNAALSVSRALIFGKHNSEEDGPDFARITFDFIIKMVQTRFSDDEELQDMMTTEYSSDGEDNGNAYFGHEEKPQEFIGAERRLENYGLIILSNALETLSVFYRTGSEAGKTHFIDNKQGSSNNNKLHGNITQICKISFEKTQRHILITLLKVANCAISRPHNACLAIKSLRFLCCLSKKNCEHLKSESGLEMTIHAEEIGRVTNARLQNECEKLRLELWDNQ